MLDWEVVTAVGVVAGALIALYFGTWNLVRARRMDLPVVAVRPCYERAPDSSQALDFQLEAGADRWRVSAVGIRGDDRSPYLARAGKRIFNPEIAMTTAYEAADPWLPSLAYDPPVVSGTLVRHPHAPSDEQLLFTVVLRSNPRVRRQGVGSVAT